jgi:hypothetical protein
MDRLVDPGGGTLPNRVVDLERENEGKMETVVKPLQLPRYNLEPLPHTYMLDAFLDPVRLRADLDFAFVISEFFMEAVSLPHSLEVCLGVYHDKALPGEWFGSIWSLQMRKLSNGGRGRQIDGVRLLSCEFKYSVDEKLGKTKLTVGSQDCEASQLDIRLYWMLAFGR